MQEGYVFNDTIANNIAVGEDYVDKQKLRKAVDIANIKEFIEGLPLSYNTKIGKRGHWCEWRTKATFVYCACSL